MTDTPPEGSKLDNFKLDDGTTLNPEERKRLQSLLLELVDKHDPQAGKQVSERYWGNELRKEIAKW